MSHEIEGSSSVAMLAFALPSSWLQAIKISDKPIGLLEISLWIMVVGSAINIFRRLRAAAIHLTIHGKKNP